jgi:hypothetical protein
MSLFVRVIVAAGMLAIVVFLALAIFRPAVLDPTTTQKREAISEQR